jgi:hypothetical protein
VRENQEREQQAVADRSNLAKSRGANQAAIFRENL